MYSIFNELIAARLQYLTFPLELAGIALALIELRFPALADYLTRQIERLAMPMSAARREVDDDTSALEHSLGTFLSRLLQAGFYAITLFYVVMAVVGVTVRGFDADWFFGFAIGYVMSVIGLTVLLVTLGVMTFFIVVGGSDFAQRFVAGRAIGTLGILIAGLGLLGELYQLLVQISI